MKFNWVGQLCVRGLALGAQSNERPISCSRKSTHVKCIYLQESKFWISTNNICEASNRHYGVQTTMVLHKSWADYMSGALRGTVQVSGKMR